MVARAASPYACVSLAMLAPPHPERPGANAMPMIRFRLIGSRADADTLIIGLHGIEGIEHIEEIDDPTLGIRDDSSSLDSASDSEAHTYLIEVGAASDSLADDVRVGAEALASERDAGIEFVDDF